MARFARFFSILGMVSAALFPSAMRAAAADRMASDLSISNLFAGPIARWEIEIPARGITSLENEPRTSIPCTVKVGTNLFKKVGIHIKGSAGSVRSIHDHPAVTLKFDRYVTNQSAFGLRKLHLNNSVQDNSRLAEFLCSDLYRRAGIPTPRTTHALVSLNGENLGLYVLKEGWDKGFLRREFGDNSGNFYDGGFVQDISEPLERDSGEGEDTRTDLIGLFRATRIRDPEKRVAEIEKRVEIERFLTYTALQILTDDWDGYVRNRNNYRIYHNPSTDRLVFMPHGMDQMFESPTSGIEPEMRGMVAARLFEVPTMRSRLNERIASLTTNIFTLVVMTNRILEAEKRVSAALAGQPDELRRVRQQMAGFRRRVVTRYYDIAGTKAEPAKFDEKGVLKLGAGWDFNSEKLSIKYWQNKSDDGVNVLGIGTSEASSRGSWRLTVALEPGHYRFEARVRSRNVEPFNNTSGNGAGIRISGSRRQNMLRGTQDWKNLTFDFELESSNEIQLIAEIAANSGEAEFDLDSLRLVRK